MAGLIAGMAGVFLIMGTRLTQGVDPVGIALCGIGALALTFATLAVKGASSGGNVMVVVGFQMLIGSAALWVPALVLETWVVNWSVTVVAAFLYTLFMPGLLATMVWFWLVRRIGATRAATFHFLNPFFGVAIAAVLLGEAIGVLDVVGVVVIALAILVVQFSKSAATT
jgi:drug/metabolite transporter (DMT)-like permease